MTITRRLLFVVLIAAAVWALAVGILAGSMFLSPSRHATVMSYYWNLPRPLLLSVPMVPAWNFARRGSLQPGDVAPDFTLQSAGRQTSVQLSSFRGRQPVVLVFGSYT